MEIDACVLAYAVYAAGRCDRLRAAVEELPAPRLGRDGLPPFLRAFPPMIVMRHAKLYGFLSQASVSEAEALLGRGFPFVRHIRRSQGFVDLLLSLGIRRRSGELLEYFAVYAFLKQARFSLSMAEMMAGDADELALFEQISACVHAEARPEVRRLSDWRFVKDMRGAQLPDWFMGREKFYKSLSCAAALGGLSPLAFSASLAAADLSAVVDAAEVFLEGEPGTNDLKAEAERYQELLGVCAFIVALCRAYREADGFAWAEHERAEKLAVEVVSIREKIRREGEAEAARLRSALAERQERLNEMQIAMDKLRLQLLDAQGCVSLADK